MASTRFSINYEPKTGDIDVEFDFVRPDDVGIYKCKAENIYGSDKTLANILILNVPSIDERPQTLNPEAYKKLGLPLATPDDKNPDRTENKMVGKPPKFIIHLPAEVKLHDGVKFQTRCKIEGYPLPKVLFVNQI
jgi:hypothetical protein